MDGEAGEPLVWSRSELLKLGNTCTRLRRQIRAGRLVTVTPGVYASQAALATAAGDARERARLLIAAARLRLGSDVAASHASAALLLDLPVLDRPGPTDPVTALRQGGRSRRMATPLGDLIVRPGRLPATDLVTVDGVLATSAARAVIDIARRHGFEAGVVCGDAVLRRGVSRAVLREIALRHPSAPGSPTVLSAVAFLDRRSESALESIARVGFHRSGLPAPELQQCVYDEYGEVIARVDFLWRAAGVVGETDGLLKYRGPDDDALVAEKLRQERLEELGFVVVRMTYRQVRYEQAATAARVRAAFDRAARWRSAS